MSRDPLLRVEGLRTHFETDDGVVRAVDGVGFAVDRGETVCIVGESGSGKSVAVESITRLVPTPPGEIVSGSVRFDGTELTDLPEKRLEGIRGARIGHVFQNPQGALNPVYAVGRQITETIRIHEDVSKREARARAIDLLDRVGIPDPANGFEAYPHELSGGQKQRVAVAVALACEPDLLIADEPTTALDVTIQAQLIELLRDLQTELDTGILFVTHDLGVVAELADRVVVMYAGKVMERGDVYEIFENPSHPYTRALLRCRPGRGGGREAIEGTLPDPIDPPAGCRFHERCPHAVAECARGEQPAFRGVDSGDDDSDGAGGTGGTDGGVGDDDGTDRRTELDANHEASCVYYGPDYDESIVRDDRDAAGSVDSTDYTGPAEGRSGMEEVRGETGEESR